MTSATSCDVYQEFYFTIWLCYITFDNDKNSSWDTGIPLAYIKFISNVINRAGYTVVYISDVERMNDQSVKNNTCSLY